MSYDTVTAYACVALRMMQYEMSEITEEYMASLIDLLFGFLTPKEVRELYISDARFYSYDLVIDTEKLMEKCE